MSDFNAPAPTPVAEPTPQPSQAAPVPAPAPQSATPTAPSAAGPTPSNAQTPAIGAPDGGREGWVPSYRLREAREAATRQAQTEYAQKMAGLQTELDRYKSQLHAVVGVTPPGDPETEGIKQQFARIFPGLAQLEQRAKEIEALTERAGDFDMQASHYWNNYGRQTMDRLFGLAAETLGGPLNDEAKRVLHSSFVGYLQSSPELSDRYSNDPSVVDEFWRTYSSNFIDPVRRSATVNAAGRTGVPLPQDTPGGAPRATPVPQPGNLDERAAAAWASYNASANAARR